MILKEKTIRRKPVKIHYDNRPVIVSLGLAILYIVGLLCLFQTHHPLRKGIITLLFCLGPLLLLIKAIRAVQKSKRCVTVEQIALNTGVSEDDLRRKLELSEIQPRYIVDGTKKYAPEDLGEVMTLLRASERPQRSESLLRPAEEKCADSQLLLRSSDTEEAQILHRN